MERFEGVDRGAGWGGAGRSDDATARRPGPGRRDATSSLPTDRCFRDRYCRFFATNIFLLYFLENTKKNRVCVCDRDSGQTLIGTDFNEILHTGFWTQNRG